MYTLAYFSSSGDMRFPASLMGCNKPEVSRCVAMISHILSKLAKSTVSFTKLSRNESDAISEGFENLNGFPNTLGAIDGCLIKVQRPNDYEGWYCRKGFGALNLQAICDHRMKILSYSIMSGCHNDKLLWQHSKIGKHASKAVPKRYHFVGDSGYSLYPWLMIPFTDDKILLYQKFNYKFSSDSRILSSLFAASNFASNDKTLCRAGSIIGS
jgi:hypothetical protein